MKSANDGYDVRVIYTDSGTIAGYAFKRPTWRVWGAIRAGYCECCAPEKRLGAFPDLAAAATALVSPLKGGNAAMTVVGDHTIYRRHKPALGPIGDSVDDLEPPFGAA